MTVDSMAPAYPDERPSNVKVRAGPIHATFLPDSGKYVRLGVGMLMSAMLHWLLMSLYDDGLSRRSPAVVAPEAYSSFTVILVPALPEQVRRPSQAVRPSSAQPRSAPALPGAKRPFSSPADAGDDAAPPGNSVAIAAGGDTPSAAAPDNTAPDLAQLLSAAKREAALVAHELNHAEGGKANFRSKVQDDLDAHFQAARDARQGWLKAAGISELTRASDGATRIYRITTPLGAFCMTYHGGSGEPSYGSCPR